MDFIGAMERVTASVAQKQYCDMQPGDVYQTYADMTKFESRYGYKPKVDIEQGLSNMYAWYQSFIKGQ
jgi:UDP-glucuronate 4-epimerase